MRPCPAVPARRRAECRGRDGFLFRASPIRARRPARFWHRENGRGLQTRLQTLRQFRCNVSLRRYLLDGEPFIGNPADGESSVGKLEIVGTGLEYVAGDGLGLFLDPLCRHENGSAPNGRGPATEGPDAVRDDRRISVDHGDIIHIQPQFIRDQLRKRGFLPLPMR